MTEHRHNTGAAAVHPGERVITREGAVRIVALVTADGVWVYGPNGLPERAHVVCDAWGGEHDQELGLAA